MDEEKILQKLEEIEKRIAKIEIALNGNGTIKPLHQRIIDEFAGLRAKVNILWGAFWTLLVSGLIVVIRELVKKGVF